MEILWKGCGKAQFPHSFRRIAKFLSFPQNFHTRKLGEITVLFAMWGFINQKHGKKIILRKFQIENFATLWFSALSVEVNVRKMFQFLSLEKVFLRIFQNYSFVKVVSKISASLINFPIDHFKILESRIL